MKHGGEIIQMMSKIFVAENGELEDGRVMLTGAGNLPCKHIVHAVGPTWRGGRNGEALILALAVTNALTMADELQCTSIAVPAISSGIFGYPVDSCAAVIVKASVDYLRRQQGNQASTLKTIMLTNNDFPTVRTFVDALKRLAGDELEAAAKAARLAAKLAGRKSRKKNSPFRVLAIGDGLTQGYHGVWKHPLYGPQSKAGPLNPGREGGDGNLAKYHPYTIRLIDKCRPQVAPLKMLTYSHAKVGMTARMMGTFLSELEAKERQQPEAGKPEPAFNAALLLIGTNDILQGRAPAEVAADIEKLHERLVSGAGNGLNCCCSVVLSLPPIDLSEWSRGPLPLPHADILENRVKLNGMLKGFARRTARPFADLNTAIFQNATQSLMWDDSMYYSADGYDKLGEVLYYVLDGAECMDHLF